MSAVLCRVDRADSFVRHYGVSFNTPGKLLLLVLVLDLLSVYLLMPYLSEQMAERFALNPALDSAALPIATWVGAFFTALTPVLILLFVSFLLMLAILIFDGTVRFLKLFTVLLWSTLPSLLVRIHCAVFYAAGWSKDPNVSWTSLGQYWAPQTNSNFVLLLSRLDLLEMISFALVVIGVRNVSTLKGRVAWMIPLVIWGGLQLVYWRALSSTGGA